MHVHSYTINESGGGFRIELDTRMSTDAKGVADCLGIQANTKIEFEAIVAELERKISAKTLLTLDAPIAPVEMPTE
ncbi:MAG: hypothetical protein WBC44_05205 [Planctomycetaceae bacterium]